MSYIAMLRISGLQRPRKNIFNGGLKMNHSKKDIYKGKQ